MSTHLTISGPDGAFSCPIKPVPAEVTTPPTQHWRTVVPTRFSGVIRVKANRRRGPKL